MCAGRRVVSEGPITPDSGLVRAKSTEQSPDLCLCLLPSLSLSRRDLLRVSYPSTGVLFKCSLLVSGEERGDRFQGDPNNGPGDTLITFSGGAKLPLDQDPPITGRNYVNRQENSGPTFTSSPF